MEVVIDQKGEETVIKIKGRLDTNTARAGGEPPPAPPRCATSAARPTT